MPRTDAATESLIELLADCYDDPDLFNSAILGRPDYWSSDLPGVGGQLEWARAVADYRVVACETGNSLGKDYLIGGLVPWWLYTRPDGLVIVTGPSQTLLGSVTWKEVRRALDTRRESGKVLKAFPEIFSATLSDGIKTSPQTVVLEAGWQALAYSTTTVERASGQHGEHLLVIVTEASGLEEEIGQALDSLNAEKMALFGNPIRPDGWFAQYCDQGDADARNGIPPHQAIRHFNTPSTASPDADKESSKYGLATKTWIDAMARRYGRDSLWFKSHILAIRPVVAADILLPESWLDFAASHPRPSLPTNHPVHQSRRIAVDLGEGVGRDSTAILVRDSLGILEVIHGGGIGLAEAATHVARLSKRWEVPPARITYDRLGIGKQLPNHLAANGITGAVGVAGSSSARSREFTNLRTEAAWALRTRLDPGLPGTGPNPYGSQPPFTINPGPWWPRMREELKALTYDLVGSQTRLLRKQDWAEKLGHSPDLADALIQSFSM